MNKLYFVYEPDENAGVIVAAKSNNEAKMSGCDRICCSYTEARAYLVKDGHTFYDDIDTKKTGFNIVGEGIIEVDFHGYKSWEMVKDYLIKIGRAKSFIYDEDGNECEVKENESNPTKR